MNSAESVRLIVESRRLVSQNAEFCPLQFLNFRRLQPTGRPSMNEVCLLQSLGQVSASQTGEVFRDFRRG